MIETLSPLITALREELKQYGEMLALLDQQQDCAIQRMADDMLHCTGAIQNHAATLQNVRRDREKRQRELACELCVAETSTFVELIPLLPAEYQPLVGSLVEENNALLARVQQRARQNHLVLSRSVELMQRFLGLLFPACESRVYDERGGRLCHALPTPPLYEAVG
jgi:flagellar biosynthesis/type III secretory pathway chaperone